MYTILFIVAYLIVGLTLVCAFKRAEWGVKDYDTGALGSMVIGWPLVIVVCFFWVLDQLVIRLMAGLGWLVEACAGRKPA